MSALNEQQVLDVMAYADGELAGDDEARVETFLEGSADARELLASFGAIGEGVRTAVAPPEGVDVVAAVMARVVPNDLDRARIKRVGRTRMVVVGASLLAVAAAVVLYINQNADAPTARDQPRVQPQIVQVPAPSDTAPAPGPLALSTAHGVQVDSVDTATQVSVFYVPANDEPSENGQSVVVWIDDPSPGGK